MAGVKQAVQGQQSDLSRTVLPERSLDNALTRLQETFRTQALDFSELRGLTAADVKIKSPGESALLPTFRKLCLLTKTAMLHMNLSCPGLPSDSIENFRIGYSARIESCSPQRSSPRSKNERATNSRLRHSNART